MWGPGTHDRGTAPHRFDGFQSGADLWGPGTGTHRACHNGRIGFNPVRICGVRGLWRSASTRRKICFNPVQICGVRGLNKFYDALAAVKEFQSGADLWGPGTWEALDKQY